MLKSNELKLEGCAPTEAVAECCREEKKGGRIYVEDGIQSGPKGQVFCSQRGFQEAQPPTSVLTW